MNIYGVVDSQGIHTDVSTSLQGAKRYATLNGYTRVSMRFNCGYSVQVLAEKINGKWRSLV